MKNQKKYGYYTLSEVVDRYMVHSFNGGRKYYQNMLIIAMDLWKELYWKTLRVPKNKRVSVDRATATVRFPGDCMRVISIRIPGSCAPEYLNYNGLKHIAEKTTAGCGCKECNCDNEACGSLNGIDFTSEDVVMNGTTYQRVIKSRLHNGYIIQEITEPFAVIAEGGATVVQMHTYTRSQSAAPLELKPCGCVKPTEENRRKCYDFGCCPVACCMTACRDQVPGEYKIDQEHGMIHLFNRDVATVDITYLSNGEACAEEIIIPEYCTEAMFAGLNYASIRFRHTQRGLYETRSAKALWAEEKQELYEFLNPIIPHQFMELQQKHFQL